MQREWSEWNSTENNFAKHASVRTDLIYGTPQEPAPGVSVMIITYKRADGLEKALQSALQQDFDQPYEIAVVDDSGYDAATDSLMKEYCEQHPHILYYRHERNLGQYANWNRACELSRTEWFCLLHDDDRMKPTYLSRCMNVAKSAYDLGLLGSYMETVRTDGEALPKTLVDKLVSLFIWLRRAKPAPLTLRDNLRHIFVLSSCLFINRTRAIELGGLNDDYFPSSDFAFAAKMNCHHRTAFLPLVLSERGIGSNESLKQSVCDDSIRAAYHLTLEIGKTLGLNPQRQRRAASIAAVISEIGVKGYNDVDYSPVKESLGMKPIYSRPWVIRLINVYSKCRWGMLLFRRAKV